MARRRARRCWTYRTGGGLVRGDGRAHARASRRGDAEAARADIDRKRGRMSKQAGRTNTTFATGPGTARPRGRTCANGAVATCFSTPAARAPRSTRAIARECVRPCTRARTRLRMNEQIAMGRATRENLLTGEETKKRRGDFLSTKDDRGRSTRERAYYDS